MLRKMAVGSSRHVARMALTQPRKHKRRDGGCRVWWAGTRRRDRLSYPRRGWVCAFHLQHASDIDAVGRRTRCSPRRCDRADGTPGGGCSARRCPAASRRRAAERRATAMRSRWYLQAIAARLIGAVGVPSSRTASPRHALSSAGITSRAPCSRRASSHRYRRRAGAVTVWPVQSGYWDFGAHHSFSETCSRSSPIVR